MIKHKSKITMENKEISDINLIYLGRFRKSLIAKKRAKSTIYNYTKDVEQFLQYARKDVDLITSDDIDNYLKTFKDMGNGYTRLVRRYRVLSSFFKFLRARGYIKENVAIQIKIKEYE